jgi:curved DNA-binding protein CbpA
MAKNHYETLGVPRDATAEQVKRAFRRAASKAHPDKEGGDAKKMAEINRAWECLGNAQRRLTYDQTGYDEGVGEDLHSEGESVLMEYFDTELNKGAAALANLIGNVARRMQEDLANMQTGLQHMELGLRNLKRSRTKVRRKTAKARNLFHLLIDTRIHRIEEDKVRCMRQIERIKKAQEALKDYESDEEAPQEDRRQTLFQAMKEQIEQGGPMYRYDPGRKKP